MSKNLVIVESPAKAKTIEKFLGKDYKVMSSYGHIRDLKKKELSIDTTTFTPEYEIPEDKQKVVSELQHEAAKADTVWLASDEDREGEAISWHLSEVLNLPPERTRRIVFHEITKQAILNAIAHPRSIDVNLVNAQQARRVLDRIVGFELSPVLWKKVRPARSAGRVQSVAVRLIVEREREIKAFKSEASYRITGEFLPKQGNNNDATLHAELNTRFNTQDDAEAFLKACAKAHFTVKDVTTRPLRRSPAPPFTTSTLQQEAAHTLGFSVAQTMRVAQRLYESGHITYMRTDSVNLSSLCINACKEMIEKTMGANYIKSRQWHTKTKGAQEAHEAIRPTRMDVTSIDTGTAQDRRLYNLIWKRTAASQMADAEIEKTTVTIETSGQEAAFVAVGEVIKFDGYLKVYQSHNSDNATAEAKDQKLTPVKNGQELNYVEIAASERFSQHPTRYNEATLVKKLEELGIGRPSTYAPTISTIQQRGYVKKDNIENKEKQTNILTLENGTIKKEIKNITPPTEKNKLIPTDIGMIVNDYLMKHFPNILDYNFTADIEKHFDNIAEGKTEWKKMTSNFYSHLQPEVKRAREEKTTHKAGERLLGTDPMTNKPVYAKIGRYGPIIQLGTASDKEKPRFAPIRKEQSIESIELNEALELLKLPRTLGKYQDKDVSIGNGRFGAYILHNNKYATLPKELNPMTITLNEAIKIIILKEKKEKERILKTFEEDKNMKIVKGKYGPYISYKGNNYSIKTSAEEAEGLSYRECKERIIFEEKKFEEKKEGSDD